MRNGKILTLRVLQRHWLWGAILPLIGHRGMHLSQIFTLLILHPNIFLGGGLSQKLRATWQKPFGTKASPVMELLISKMPRDGCAFQDRILSVPALLCLFFGPCQDPYIIFSWAALKRRGSSGDTSAAPFQLGGIRSACQKCLTDQLRPMKSKKGSLLPGKCLLGQVEGRKSGRRSRRRARNRFTGSP